MDENEDLTPERCSKRYGEDRCTMRVGHVGGHCTQTRGVTTWDLLAEARAHAADLTMERDQALAEVERLQKQLPGINEDGDWALVHPDAPGLEALVLQGHKGDPGYRPRIEDHEEGFAWGGDARKHLLDAFCDLVRNLLVEISGERKLAAKFRRSRDRYQREVERLQSLDPCTNEDGALCPGALRERQRQDERAEDYEEALAEAVGELTAIRGIVGAGEEEKTADAVARRDAQVRHYSGALRVVRELAEAREGEEATAAVRRLRDALAAAQEEVVRLRHAQGDGDAEEPPVFVCGQSPEDGGDSPPESEVAYMVQRVRHAYESSHLPAMNMGEIEILDRILYDYVERRGLR